MVGVDDLQLLDRRDNLLAACRPGMTFGNPLPRHRRQVTSSHPLVDLLEQAVPSRSSA
jgi:hypothetical protein